MRYISLVAVVDCLHYLNPKELRLQLRHLPIWLHFQVTVKAASVHVLHKDKHLLMRLKSLIKLPNVWMIQLFHDLHFTLYRLPAVWLK